MGLVTLWKNWLPWSQGVVIAPLLAKFRSPGPRIFWFVMLIATTAAFVYQSAYMVQDYLTYQKTTNIQLFYQPEAPFPAVTFCNLNPFKRSMVHHSKELSNLVTVYNYVKKVKQAQHLSTHATPKEACGQSLRRPWTNWPAIGPWTYWKSFGDSYAHDYPMDNEHDNYTVYDNRYHNCDYADQHTDDYNSCGYNTERDVDDYGRTFHHRVGVDHHGRCDNIAYFCHRCDHICAYNGDYCDTNYEQRSDNVHNNLADNGISHDYININWRSVIGHNHSVHSNNGGVDCVDNNQPSDFHHDVNFSVDHSDVHCCYYCVYECCNNIGPYFDDNRSYNDSINDRRPHNVNYRGKFNVGNDNCYNSVHYAH